MKAPTVSTYQHYVLFRMAARQAIAHARHARKCRKLGLYPSMRLNYDKARASMAEARLYWTGVEMMEV